MCDMWRYYPGRETGMHPMRNKVWDFKGKAPKCGIFLGKQGDGQ